MRTSKLLSWFVLSAVALTGPLAPLSVSAQVPGMPAEPMVTPIQTTEGDAVAAGFMNVVYVPGKAIVCGVGAVMATFLMLITFGSGYPTAAGVFREGCNGTWVLTADHVSGKIPPDWVQTDNYQTYYSQNEGIYP
jgi:hypothetical protein